MEQAHFERWTRQWTADAARDGVNARKSANRFAGLVMLAPFGILVALAAVAGLGVLVAMIPWIVTKVFGGLLVLTALGLGGIVVAALPRALREPTGCPITREEVPLLFERVERAATAIDVKPPAVIRLDEADGAEVTWWARRAFGKRTGHLRIGLATIAMLEHEELDSVITLALANMLHADAEHLRNIQHAHAWWSEVDARIAPQVEAGFAPGATSVQKAHAYLLSVTIGAVATAVVPRLAGMERTFWRDREMASDRIAVTATSRVATSRALVRSQVRASWWRAEVEALLDAAQRASAAPDPSFAIGAASTAGGAIAPVAGSVMFARSLTEPDDPMAPNTPIGRRVAAIGMGIDRPGVEHITFADAAAWSAAPASGQLWNACFGGGPGGAVLGRVGAAWSARHATEWRDAHQVVAALDQAGQRYASEANQRELRADQYLLVSGWARARYGRDVARDWLRYATHIDPYHARAALDLGRELVTSGDPAGVGWLEHAANLAPDLMDEAHAWAAAWYRACGDQPGADTRVDRRARHRQTMRAIHWTSFEARVKSKVSPALPSEREKQILRAIVGEHPGIVLAAIARHEVRGAPMERLPTEQCGPAR